MENERLVYGNSVIYDDKDSKYVGMVGKVVEATGTSIMVKFDEIKKPVMFASDALTKVDTI